jgi:hypothetical protein
LLGGSFKWRKPKFNITSLLKERKLQREKREAIRRFKHDHRLNRQPTPATFSTRRSDEDDDASNEESNSDEIKKGKERNSNSEERGQVILLALTQASLLFYKPLFIVKNWPILQPMPMDPMAACQISRRNLVCLSFSTNI